MRNPVKQLETLTAYSRRVGWATALALRFSDAKAAAGLARSRIIELKPKNAQHPLAMRTLTSDRDVFGQVFIQDDYGSVVLSNPKVIFDLGANVGYASAFFLSKYPTANLRCVEPDPGNFEMCQRNLVPYGGRADCLFGAVWPECSRLVLDTGSFRDGREWTTQVRKPRSEEEQAQGSGVPAYDIPAILDWSGADEIDLLKIDIERSEVELFSRNTAAWLPRVRNLCIELHDEECERIFFEALAEYSYDLSHAGDLTVCCNLRRKT